MRFRHLDKDKDDPVLQQVLAQPPDGPSPDRRRRTIDSHSNLVQVNAPVSTHPSPVLAPEISREVVSPEPFIRSFTPSKLYRPSLPPLIEAPKSREEPFQVEVHSEVDYNFNRGEVPIETREAEIFTDSGYASIPHATLSPSRCDQEDSARAINPKPASFRSGINADDEAKTVYSAATSIIPGGAQESIACVCEDIYNNLQKEIDVIGYRSMASELPRLIKTFAMRLGANKSSHLNLQIMHFIHKHHG